MNLKILTPSELIQRAADGWRAEHAELAQELVSRWKTSLCAGGQPRQVGENSIHFDLDLTGTRLHGIDNVACLVLFAGTIEGLADAQTRAIALYILQDGGRFFTASQVREIAERHGIQIESSRALEVCNDLVINNVLAWHEDAYSIANHSIVHYARKMRIQNGSPQTDPALTHLPA